jgi:hypothetical protein
MIATSADCRQTDAIPVLVQNLEAGSKPSGTGSFLRSRRSKNVPVPFSGDGFETAFGAIR